MHDAQYVAKENEKAVIYFFVPLVVNEINENHFIFRYCLKLKERHQLKLVVSISNSDPECINFLLKNNIDILDSDLSQAKVRIFEAAAKWNTILINFSSPWLYSNIVDIKLSFPQIKVIDILYNGLRLHTHLNLKNLFDVTIVQHSSLLKVVRQANSVGRYHLCRLGIDSSVFKPRIDRKVNLKPTFGWIGRNSPEKQLEFFLSLAKIYSKHAKFEILTSKFFTGIHKAYVNDPNIEFFFSKSDQFKINWMQNLDVIVNTSVIEGLPISLLESSSIGLPILSFNVGGISDLVSDSVNGRLIDEGDNLAFSQALFRLIEDKKYLAEIKEKSFKHRFSYDLNSEFLVLDNLITELLKNY